MKKNKPMFELGFIKNVSIILIVALILTVAITFAVPDENCYKQAGIKDNLVQNFFNESTLTQELHNPCTDTYMIATIYEDYKDHVLTRIVFENGDIYGFTGAAKQISVYILCSDGRAQVQITNIQSNEGKAWGLWSNSPMSRNNYVIEQCSTL